MPKADPDLTSGQGGSSEGASGRGRRLEWNTVGHGEPCPYGGWAGWLLEMEQDPWWSLVEGGRIRVLMR